MIELSVIVIVIGILIAGVIKGNNLYTKSKLRIAQRLTNNSPVLGIDDLGFWYETTLNNSFPAASRRDGAEITQWNDIKPTISGTIYNLDRTDSSPATKYPLYKTDVFGKGIPGVKFDGSNDALFNPSVSINNAITYFVVARRSQAVANASTFTFRNPNDANDFTTTSSFNAFWESGSNFKPFANGVPGGDGLASLPNPGNDSSYIATSIFHGSYNSAYLNGAISSNQPAINSTFSNGRLTVGAREEGAFSASSPNYSLFWNGHIAEIILFNRALKSKERKSIEQYLSQKYGIAVTH